MNSKILFAKAACLFFLFLNISSCTQKYGRTISENLAEVKSRPFFDQSLDADDNYEASNRKVIFKYWDWAIPFC